MKLAKPAVTFALIFAIILKTSCVLLAQSQPNTENGVKTFGSYIGSDIDTVNLQNGNLMLHIPLFSYPQRGELGLGYSLQLSSKNWSVGQFYDSTNTLRYRWMLGSQAGLLLTGSYDVLVQRGRTITTDLAGNQTESDFDYAVRTADGAVHWLSAGVLANGNMVTLDGSNFQFTLIRGTKFDRSDDTGVLKDSKGNTYNYPTISSDYSKIAPASGTSANLVSHVAFTNTLMPPGNNTIQIFNDVGMPSTMADANGNTMDLGFFFDPVTADVIIASVVDGNGNTINFSSGTGAGPAPTANCPTLSTASGAYFYSFPGPNGSISPFTICSTSVTLAPAFSQQNVEAPKNDILFKSYPLSSQPAPVGGLIMPDGTKWAFAYDAYGNVTTINLPTGGVITYEWTEIPLPACQDGNTTAVSRAVSTRTVNDLINPAQIWHYTWGTIQPDGTITNYVRDPNGNETAHVFKSPVANLPCALYEIETRSYQGTQGGTPLKIVDTHYVGVLDSNDDPTNSLSFASRVVADTITTTLPGNKVSQIVRQYDGYPANTTFGKITNEKAYDYTGLLLRETATTYQWQVDAAYLNAGLLDLPASVIVKDGSGCKMAETDYFYDESAYANVNYESAVGTLPAGTHQAVSTPRGNPTTTTHMLFDHSQCTPAAQTAVSSHTKWYDTGEAYHHIDPLGHTTTVSYDLAYGGMLATQTCSPQTSGVNHCVSGTYDFLTGLLESFTNENATTQASGNTAGDSAHTSNFVYDTSWRLTSAQAPPDPGNGSARAQTGFTFGTAYPFTIQKQKSTTTAMSDVSTVYLDGVGRAYHTEHAVPGGPAKVDTAFDGLGHAVSVSNPYFSTSDATYGVTQPQYDGMGRATQITKQDGSISIIDYSGGNCTVTTDEAGKLRKACSDALGRLIEVDEPGIASIGAQAQATVDIGAMKSVMIGGHAAANATGSITLSGVEQVKDIPGQRYCFTLGTNGRCLDWEFYDDTFIYDNGSVQVSVNGQLFSYAYSSGDTVSSIANSLASSIRTSSSTTDYASVAVNTSTTPPTATIYLTARNANAAGNGITLSLSATSYNTATFAAASFNPSASGAALTGGIDGYAGAPVTDSGTVTISVGSFTSPIVSYGLNTANSTAPQVAAALANALAGSGFAATFTPGSTVLTIKDTTYRASSNGVAVQVHPATSDAGDFPVASFNASGALSGGADPVLTALGNVTLYQYDGLGNMLCVEQHGGVMGTGCSSSPANDATSPWRVRRFTYDSLGRILTAKNPESGLITYSYDADGNLLQKTSPAPNQTGSATQTVSYCYDALHRVTGKGYGAQSCPLATPVVGYTYDVGINAIGYLTSLTDQVGSGSYTYDIMGRIAAETRVISGVSKSMSYSYNLDGSLKTLTNPSGAVITYTPDSAGRITSAVDSSNGINYVSGASYGPDSGLTGFVSGNSGTFAGITNAFSYNKHLQPVNMSASSPSQTLYSIGYDFHSGTVTPGSGTDNGNVFGITNYKDATRSQTFTYDALNRLTAAQNAGTNCSEMTANGKTKYWGNSYAYDAWGNLLNKSVTKCSAENFSVAALANNQLSGYSYDAAGNMTSDPTDGVTLSYDQENRLIGAAGYTYAYDADGNRVRKSNGSTATLYWYMTPGIVGESDLSGNLTDEYVFFDGERVARKSSNGVFYYFSDHLKTASVITDSLGNIKSESDYYPWGGELQFTNNDSNHYKFGGHEQDSESGLYNYGARHYSNGLGRFITPDWANKPEAVPYSTLDNPQSLNLYGYALNNPLSLWDDDGHAIVYADGLKNAQLVKDSVQAILANPHTSGNLSGYVGPNSPNLTIQSGDLSKGDTTTKSPDGQTVTTTIQGETEPGIQTSTSTVNGVTSAPVTTLTDATITIDNRTNTGDTPGVMVHESVHAGEALANPTQFSKDAKAEKSLPHDQRPQEQRANAAQKAYTKEIKQAVKQIEKDRKKENQ